MWYNSLSDMPKLVHTFKLVQIQYDTYCFIWILNMSKLVQIQYDTNCYGSCDFQTCLNMLKHVQTCSDSIWYELIRFLNMSEHVQTCLNLFRFNMILIVTIHRILKHVWTCLDSIWYELIHFLNMSRLIWKHGEIH